MNSRIVHIVALARSTTLAISLSIVMVAGITPAAFANSGIWTVDPEASDARLFQGSAANPHALNTGVARVTGNVELDTNDLDKSVFDLHRCSGQTYGENTAELELVASCAREPPT